MFNLSFSPCMYRVFTSALYILFDHLLTLVGLFLRGIEVEKNQTRGTFTRWVYSSLFLIIVINGWIEIHYEFRAETRGRRAHPRSACL